MKTKHQNKDKSMFLELFKEKVRSALDKDHVNSRRR